MTWETWDTHVLGTITLLLLAVIFTAAPTIGLWATLKFRKELPVVMKVFIIPLVILFYAIAALAYCGAYREAKTVEQIYSQQRALEQARQEQK